MYGSASVPSAAPFLLDSRSLASLISLLRLSVPCRDTAAGGQTGWMVISSPGQCERRMIWGSEGVWVVREGRNVPDVFLVGPGN